jgi:hypothetical protein
MRVTRRIPDRAAARIRPTRSLAPGRRWSGGPGPGRRGPGKPPLSPGVPRAARPVLLPGAGRNSHSPSRCRRCPFRFLRQRAAAGLSCWLPPSLGGVAPGSSPGMPDCDGCGDGCPPRPRRAPSCWRGRPYSCVFTAEGPAPGGSLLSRDLHTICTACPRPLRKQRPSCLPMAGAGQCSAGPGHRGRCPGISGGRRPACPGPQLGACRPH